MVTGLLVFDDVVSLDEDVIIRMKVGMKSTFLLPPADATICYFLPPSHGRFLTLSCPLKPLLTKQTATVRIPPAASHHRLLLCREQPLPGTTNFLHLTTSPAPSHSVAPS
ncbi:hypothetical protein L1887_18212 [Cichorium endivia]|nr:hypothetical protein L1887_18212 [Cichorium endivia]